MRCSRIRRSDGESAIPMDLTVKRGTAYSTQRPPCQKAVLYMASALQGAEEYDLHGTVDHSPFTNNGPQDQDEQVHLASLAEKKRLWWRNAVVNAVFISSWCVFFLFPVCWSFLIFGKLLGSSSLPSFRFTTNGCSLRSTLDSHTPSL
jgi:hypothetical protein